MADDKLRGGIEFDTTSAKASITELNRNIRVIESSFKASASALGDWTKSAEGNEQRIQSLNGMMDLQRQKISNLTEEYQKVVAEQGESSKAAQDLEIKINRETESLNKSAIELQTCEQRLEGFSAGAGEAESAAGEFGAELENSAEVAEEAGSKFASIGSTLKGLGVAVAAGVTAMVAATVAAGKSLIDMAMNSAAAADQVDKMSQKIGLSRTGYQEWDYILSQCGMDVNKLQAGVKTLTQQMQAAEEGSSKSVAAFEALGLSVTDVSGNLKDQEVMFNEVIAALQGMENETERAAIASQLFGRSGTELAPLLNTSAEAIEELRQNAHNLGMVLGDEVVDAGVDFTDALDTAKRTVSGLKNTISAELLPGLTDILYGFSDLVAGQEGAEEALTAGADSIVESIGNMAPRITTVLGGVVSTIGTIAPGIITALIGGLVSNLPSITSAGSAIILTLLQAIIAALPDLTAGALQLVMALVDGILSNLPSLIEAAMIVVATLASGIAEALPELIPTIVTTMVTICETLLGNLDLILEAALEIMMALIMGLVNAIPELIAALPKIITAIVGFVSRNLPTIVTAGIEILLALILGLIEAIPELVAALPQIISAIWDGIKAVNWLELGKNIIGGIKDGVIQAGKALITSVVGVAKDALDAVKNFLGIRSPSRKAREQVGEPFGQGIIGGAVAAIEEGIGEINTAMGSVTGKLTAKVQTEQFSPIDQANALMQGMQMIAGQLAVDHSGSAATGSSQPLILELDGTTLGRILLPYLQQEAKRLGLKLQTT